MSNPRIGQGNTTTLKALISALSSGTDPLGEISNIVKPLILKSEITASPRGEAGWRAMEEIMQTIIRMNTIRLDNNGEPTDLRRSQAAHRGTALEMN